ncbi:MAG: hypothetical protein JO125_05870 [Chloroflexi bacterium]|nr:hypothetical protein [Ktedonobacteraceae bacterium]MBV9706914.1 hypothetical protein [Chloroflexota bacterium]
MATAQSATSATRVDRTQGKLSLALFCGGYVFAILYVVLVALSALPGLHLSATPLTAWWPWTSMVEHIFASVKWLPTVLLVLTLLLLIATYVGTIIAANHLTESSSNKMHRPTRRTLFLLLGGAVIFGLILLLQPRFFADDVFSYIFSGRMLVLYHADPFTTAPAQFSSDPYLPWVILGRNTPTIYSPLWLCIASLLVAVHGNTVMTLLLFKGVELIAHLLNCLLIWAILGKVTPSRSLVGTLLYAWNPLAMIELAGSGHNEGILLSFLLLAVWLYVQAKTAHRIGTLFVLGLALSTNLIMLLLVPLYAWFAVRTERHASTRLWGLCWRILIALVPAVIIMVPFWHGASTFFAINSSIDVQHFVHSPLAMLAIPTRALFQFVAEWLHFSPFLHPLVAADLTLRASAVFIFVLIYAGLFGRVRRAPTTSTEMHYSPDSDQTVHLPGLDVLLTSWGIAILWYVLLVSGWFWPWYMLWLLWIVPLRRLDAFTITVLLLSGAALFIYTIY